LAKTLPNEVSYIDYDTDRQPASNARTVLNALEEIEGVTTTSSICDLGCGNGYSLIELAKRGFTALTGVDYSLQAIELARRIAAKEECAIEYRVFNIVSDTVPQRYDVVLDKGTFDAICLHHSNLKASYIAAVRQLTREGGVFGITSCNFTEQEITALFTEQGFTVLTRVKYPTFTFGGQQGSTVCTVFFTRVIDKCI
jgi:2-polyprenyl-3-methyl-5-hydroxy-6-metoxy-1,4-benzoquinol methylase